MTNTKSEWQQRLTQSPAQRIAIETLLAESSDYCFDYPWNGLEEKLSEAGENHLKMIGYGSLLNPESAARTISNTPKIGHPPVIAFGAKRLFNYVMPQDVIARYSVGVKYPGNMCAALNTRFTGKVDDVLNGRVISLHIEDLDALRDREKGYNLMPVSFLPWDDIGSTPLLGFVLCATERPWQGNVYVNDSIEPFPPYLQVCRDGVELVSREFHRCFLDTTKLADGVTCLAEWCTKTEK